MRILPPALVALCVAMMAVLHLAVPEPAVVAGSARWLGLLAIVGGASLTVAAARLFKRRRANINTFKTPTALVTDGPFRVSRNPIYLGFTVLLVGAAVVLGSALPFAVAAAFAVIADRWYIPFEERAMRAEFGAAFDAYAQRVRRWL
ncbi:MAG: isoprenylcysteine carboxylmethyltransferase family protein [Methylacidiphilales bacterium]|nr:isoprenylcysteine carboxylmethyltransferase family protein [Candidatus Methylacidiphilales bacterium]